MGSLSNKPGSCVANQAANSGESLGLSAVGGKKVWRDVAY
jgi:hypothetical protein